MNNSILSLWIVLLLAGFAKHTPVNATPLAPDTSAEKQAAEPPAMPSRYANRKSRVADPDIIIKLKNPSFDPDSQGKISTWSQAEHSTGNSYTFVADSENALSIPSSARIRRHGSEPYGTLEQLIRVHPLWHNKTVRLTGWLRSDGISGTGGALILRAEGGSGQILDSNFMENARVKGTQDWKRYSIELKIPPSSFHLLVGVTLIDGGTLWADDLSIELID